MYIENESLYTPKKALLITSNRLMSKGDSTHQVQTPTSNQSPPMMHDHPHTHQSIQPPNKPNYPTSPIPNRNTCTRQPAYQPTDTQRGHTHHVIEQPPHHHTTRWKNPTVVYGGALSTTTEITIQRKEQHTHNTHTHTKTYSATNMCSQWTPQIKTKQLPLPNHRPPPHTHTPLHPTMQHTQLPNLTHTQKNKTHNKKKTTKKKDEREENNNKQKMKNTMKKEEE